MVRFVTVLALTACVSAEPPGVDRDVGDETDDAGPDTASADSADTDPTDLPATAGLVGVLVDARGVPIADEDVLACSAFTCIQLPTDATGAFAFEVTPPYEIALKTKEDLEASPRRAAALQPCHQTVESFVDVGELFVPDLPAPILFGNAWEAPVDFEAGDGLVLTLVRRELAPPLGGVLVGVAASRLPASRVPALPGLGNEVVEAAYALHPFAARSAVPIGVRLPSTLPAGTEVRFRTVSELHGRLSEPVPGVADGAFVATLPGEGIDELTHVVVTVP